MTQPTSTNAQIEFARDRLVREKSEIETAFNVAVERAASALDCGAVDAKWFHQMCDAIEKIANVAIKRIDDEYNVLCDQHC
jgi:hypothetical protein